MKLLYITPYIPWPLDTGGNQAFYMMADFIRNHYDLSILLRVKNQGDRNAVAELKKRWDNVAFYVYDENDYSHEEDDDLPENMSFFDRLLFKSYDAICRSINRKKRRKYRKYSQKDLENSDLVRGFSTLFDDDFNSDLSFCNYVSMISREGFDVIQVEFYEFLPLIYLLPSDVKKIFVHHEIRFVRAQNEMSKFKKLLLTDTILFEKQKAQELAALSAYDIVITLTETDRNILCDFIPEEKIFVSPAITNSLSQYNMPWKRGKDLVFVGGNSHFPNYDAVVWYIREVLPLLRKTHVVPQLFVVGKWRGDIVDKIKKNVPEVSFVGFVDDLISFLNGKISIVPLRIGSGMRMKILDSISAGSPIVTTSKGCEGLPMFDGEHCFIADTAEGFANSILKIVADDDIQRAFSENSQKIDMGMLNVKKLLNRRAMVYEQLFNARSTPEKSE